MEATMCEGDGCGRRLAETGQRLCLHCLSALTDRIKAMSVLYRSCGSALEGGMVTGLREKTSGGPMPGLALNVAAVEARADILTVLASWSGLVVQERRLAAPRRDAGVLSGFLLYHASWLASHPAVSELTAEVSRVVRAARRAVDCESGRRIAVGPCVVPACGGELTGTVLPGHGMLVQCGTEPTHSWDGPQWTKLRREMEPPGSERWLAAPEISRLWRTPSGTVYRLASEQRWRRVTRAGRTYYAESDVHASFNRRAERSR